MLAEETFFSELLPILFYLIFLKRNKGEGLWVIFLYCCTSWLTERFFFNRLHINIPDYAYNSGFTILEFTLISFVFYRFLRSKKLKFAPILGALIFYPIAIVNFTKEQEGFDSIPASVEAIVIITYCILALYEQINDPKVVFVYTTKKFWVTIAFFLYFSSTLFLFLYARNLSQEDLAKYWAINNFFEILKNILFSVSFIMKRSKDREAIVDYNLDM